jgi:hypothetical protein
MKKMKILLILVLILVFIALLIYIVTDHKKDFSSYSGIYTIDGNSTELKLYFTDSKLYFSVNSPTTFEDGTCDIEDNEVKCDFFTFKPKKDKIIFKSDNEKYKSGTYTKTLEFTDIDWYEYYYEADYDYFSSKYNGLYELNNNKMYVFQTDEETIYVACFDKDELVFEEWLILEDNTLYAGEDYNFKIDNNELILSADTEYIDILDYIGKYKLSRKLDVNDAISIISIDEEIEF